MEVNAKVRTCLWFDNQIEEAAKYYVGSGRDRPAASRAMHAAMNMVKIDIAALQAAFSEED